MKTREIFQICVANQEHERLLLHVQQICLQLQQYADIRVECYRHAGIDTEFSLHMCYDIPAKADVTALRTGICETLNDWGVLHHSIWTPF